MVKKHGLTLPTLLEKAGYGSTPAPAQILIFEISRWELCACLPAGIVGSSLSEPVWGLHSKTFERYRRPVQKDKD